HIERGYEERCACLRDPGICPRRHHWGSGRPALEAPLSFIERHVLQYRRCPGGDRIDDVDLGRHHVACQSGAPRHRLAGGRANRVWKSLLENYEPPPLDPNAAQQITAFVERRKGEIARGII